MPAAKNGKMRLAQTGSEEKSSAAAPVPITEWVLPKAPAQPTYGNQSSTKDSAKNEKRSKQLLGELYPDREYLLKLKRDKDFSSNPNAKISNLVQDALKYLDTRTEFWRQQKPNMSVNKSHKRVIQGINNRNYQMILQKEKESKARIQSMEKSKLPKALPVMNAQPPSSTKIRKPLDAPTIKRDAKAYNILNS
jgi:hypothetical protein